MERYFPGSTFDGNVLRDDLDVNASKGAGANVARLLAMARAVAAGQPPTHDVTSSAK